MNFLYIFLFTIIDARKQKPNNPHLQIDEYAFFFFLKIMLIFAGAIAIAGIIISILPSKNKKNKKNH